MKKYLLPIIIVLIWGGWTIVLIRHGMGYHIPFTPITGNKYQDTGALGDSYGTVAALMAALAAAGAFLAFQEQREFNAKQSFDNNFFSLLSHFRDTVNQIDVDNIRKVRKRGGGFEEGELIRKYEGKDAIRRMTILLKRKIIESDFKDIKMVSSKWGIFFDKWNDDLGHYFRLLYHIYRMIDEKCPSDKQYYSRIVRAHLSNSEVLLIGYNCICGEGREKFVHYVRKYSLMHNYHVSKENSFDMEECKFLRRKLGEEAFRFRELPPITYN